MKFAFTHQRERFQKMKRAAVEQPSQQPRKRRCATVKKRDDMHCCPVCMNVLTPAGVRNANPECKCTGGLCVVCSHELERVDNPNCPTCRCRWTGRAPLRLRVQREMDETGVECELCRQVVSVWRLEQHACVRCKSEPPCGQRFASAREEATHQCCNMPCLLCPGSKHPAVECPLARDGCEDLVEEFQWLARDKGPDHPEALELMQRVGRALLQKGRFGRALALNQECLRRHEKRHGGLRGPLACLRNLVLSFVGLRRHREAVPVLVACVGAEGEALGRPRAATIRCLRKTAEELEKEGHEVEAQQLRELDSDAAGEKGGDRALSPAERKGKGEKTITLQ